jgi:uncharacterized membrane protein
MQIKTNICVTFLVVLLLALAPLASAIRAPVAQRAPPSIDDGNTGQGASSRAPDFTLTRVGLQLAGTGQGANIWWVIIVTSTGGFNGRVDFTVTGLPANTNHYFYPSNVTPPANGAVSIFFRVNTTATTPAGWFNGVSVTGKNASLTHSVPFTISVSNGAFATGEIIPFEVNAAPGLTVNVSFLIIGQKGCSGNVWYNKNTDGGLGSTWTFNPASPANLPLNSILVVKLSVAVPGAAAPGRYNHLLWMMPSCAGGGGNGFGVAFMVIVHASNSFSLDGRPWIQTVASGEATTFTFDIQSYGTFSDNVKLAMESVLPAGVKATFGPSTVKPKAGGKNTTTLTVTTDKTTLGGIYPLLANGTTATLKANATVYLWVTTDPDFTVSGTPSSQYVVPGGSVTYTVDLESIKGFKGKVTLSILSPPSGATVTLGTKSFDLKDGDIVNTSLKVTAGGAMALGDYVLRVVANNTTLYHSTDLGLKVVNTIPADFNISATPSSIMANAYKGYDFNVKLGSLNSFAGAVDLTVEGVPTGVKATFNASKVNVPSGGSPTAKLTLTPNATTPVGSYFLNIVGQNGTKVHDAKVLFRMLELPGVMIVPTPDPVSILTGSWGKVTLLVNSTKGFVGSVDFSGVVLPAGFSATFTPASVTVNGTTSMNISVAGTVTPGNYTLDFEGASGPDRFPASLVVKVQDFSISSPKPLNVTLPGGKASYLVSLSGKNGFSGPVPISVSGLPANVTASITGSPVTVPGSASIELTVGGSLASGSYGFKAKGLVKGVTREVALTLNITDFNVSIDPVSTKALPGTSKIINVAVSSKAGFTGAVALVPTVPAPLTSSLGTSSIDAPGSTTLQIGVPSTTTPGVYNISLKGTYSTFARTANGTVTVQDFALGIGPSVALAQRGSTASYNVTVSGIMGFDGKVALSVIGLPSDTTAAFDPVSISPSVGSILKLAVGTGAPLGNHTLTLRGTNGTRHLELTFHLWIAEISLKVVPASHTLLVGEKATSTITIADPTGVPGPIQIELRDKPVGASLSLNTTTLVSHSSAALDIDTAGMAPGNYSLTVGIVGSSTMGAVKVSITVQDYKVVVEPVRVNIIPGQTITAKVSIGPANGFARMVNLTLALAPSGAAKPPEVTLGSEGIAPGTDALIKVKAVADTTPGTYIANIDSTSPAKRSASLTIAVTTIPEKGFTFTVTPPLLEVKAGKSGTYTVALNGTGNFADKVYFSVSGLPAGAVPNFSAQWPTPPATVTLRIDTLKTTAPGEYNLTVTGQSGTLSMSKSVVLKVTKQKTPTPTNLVSQYSLLPFIVAGVAAACIVAGFLVWRRRKGKAPVPQQGPVAQIPQEDLEQGPPASPEAPPAPPTPKGGLSGPSSADGPPKP